MNTVTVTVHRFVFFDIQKWLAVLTFILLYIYIYLFYFAALHISVIFILISRLLKLIVNIFRRHKLLARAANPMP